MKDLNPITQPVFRRKDPGIQVDASLISELLNLVPDAALVVHRVQGVIYTANSAFIRLTAFSQKEISGAGVRTLLPDVDTLKVASGESHTAILNRRQREAVPVIVQVNSLDSGGQWILLSLIPQSVSHRNLDQFHEKIFNSLLSLMRLYDVDAVEEALVEVCNILHLLLDTELVCVYQADSEFPQLNKVASHENDQAVFPPVLPSTDLIRQDNDLVWIPGKRVITEAQKAGRKESLEYVLSLPLGQPGALYGLIVAGGRQQKLEDRFVQVLSLFGAAISAILQQLILVHTLEEKISQWNFHRNVWDSVVENDVTGVIIVRPDLTIDEMNLAAEEILEYPGGEVIGKGVDSVLIGNDRIMPVLYSAVSGVQSPNLGLVMLHRRNGQEFPAHIQVIPVMADQGVQSIIVYILDVSDQEAIRARTQQLEHRAVLGEFTAMFAHEVRNPINNLSTGLQVLASRLEESDANQDLIERMLHDCNRLDHLMEDVLGFSKTHETHLEETDIPQLIKRIADRWLPRMTRKSIKLFFQSEENIPRIVVDIRSLEQVFTNLISNAIDAMSENGGTLGLSIQMGVIENRPHVEIAITDTGPGIPDDVREHIFEPFVTTKPQGTGLGLAITKRIVNAHRGTINITSYPGCTIFHVFLPTAEGE